MIESGLNIGSLLDIIFNTTNKSKNILADRYLLKDVSMIYKWKKNKAVLKSDDISKIVDFVISESTRAQHRMIRDKIEDLICNSSLKEDFKKAILNIEAFDEFLVEAINVSTSEYHSKDQLSKTIKPPVNSVGVEGEYTGVVKFDLTLSKNKGDKHKNIAGESDMAFRSSVKFIEKDKMGKLQRYILRGRTALSIVAFVVIASSIVTAIMVNGHQNQGTNVAAKMTVQAGLAPANTAVQEQPAKVTADTPTITPMPTHKPAIKERKPSTQSVEQQNKEVNNDVGNYSPISKTVNANINLTGNNNVAPVGNDIALSIENITQASTPIPTQTP